MRFRRILLVLLIWLGVATFFVGQTLANAASRGRPVSFVLDILNEYAYWLAFAVLTPLYLWAARSWRFEAGARWRALRGHLGMIVVLGGLQVALADVAMYLLLRNFVPLTPGQVADLPGQMLRGVPYLWTTFAYKYVAIIGILLAIDYRRRWEARAVEAARLERDLAQAQLANLRAQLHPHFLFNALHSAAMLSRTDAEATHRMLVELSQLLRRSLEQQADEVTLEQELDFTDRYLAIERVRFGDRLRVTLDADEEVLTALVPGLLLQPLVENAVRHGVMPSMGLVHLEVKARAEAGLLVLQVEDDGAGLPPGYVLGTGGGVGLTNIAARLARQYDGAASLALERRPTRGTRARVALPLKSAAGGPA